jgi:mRNA interferase HigB
LDKVDSIEVPKKGTLFLTRTREHGTKTMRIISKKTLKDYWEKEPAAKAALEAWHAEAKNAEWTSPADVKASYGNASILKDGRVVFNICGNKHRLVVWINYDFFTIYIRFVGTHKQYDEIDAQTI